MSDRPVIHIVDDDPQVCKSLDLLMRSVGFETAIYGSAESFLNSFSDEPGPPRCLILDVRMQGLSGLGLQDRLREEGVRIPIIVMTGYSTVSTAVQAMGAGAIDFIEKPFSEQTLLGRVSAAIDEDAEYQRQRLRRADVSARYATLSPREREVMDLMVAGKQTKQIASLLDIGDKTVAKHRARVFEKMRVDNVATLVHLAVNFALTDSVPDVEVLRS